MPKYPQLISKEKLAELSMELGPNGKYLAKDGLSWVALNKNDEGAFKDTVKAFETFEAALKWLQK